MNRSHERRAPRSASDAVDGSSQRRESAKKVAADEVTTILRRHTGHDDRARYRKVGLPGSRHGRAVRCCRPSTQLKPREIDRLDLNLNLDFTRACQRVMAMTILVFGFIRVKTSSFNVVQMVSRCRSEIGALTAFDRVVDQDPVGSNRRNAGVGAGRPIVDRLQGRVLASGNRRRRARPRRTGAGV